MIYDAIGIYTISMNPRERPSDLLFMKGADNMKVLLIEPHKPPKPIVLDGSLASMQNTVGGTIQAVYPFSESVALVCNDEGKLLGLPLNRALHYEDTGKIYDIICGTFFLCAAPSDSDSFASLNDEQVAKYTEKFSIPESFVHVNGELLCIPDAERYVKEVQEND